MGSHVPAAMKLRMLRLPQAKEQVPRGNVRIAALYGSWLAESVGLTLSALHQHKFNTVRLDVSERDWKHERHLIIIVSD